MHPVYPVHHPVHLCTVTRCGIEDELRALKAEVAGLRNQQHNAESEIKFEEAAMAEAEQARAQLAEFR